MDPERYRVTPGWLNIREAPSTSSRVIGRLRREELVEPIAESENGRWVKYKVRDMEGWSAKSFLTKVPGAEAKGSEFPWMSFAEKEKGITEVPGMGNNPRVIEYLKATSNLGSAARSRDETPWCSAFVNWCLAQAGIPGTKSAVARSWLDWGQPIETPRVGCIVVFSREVKFGHVGFYLSETESEIKVLGGNQQDAVTQVFQVSEKFYPKANLLGYRLPKETHFEGAAGVS